MREITEGKLSSLAVENAQEPFHSTGNDGEKAFCVSYFFSALLRLRVRYFRKRKKVLTMRYRAGLLKVLLFLHIV